MERNAESRWYRRQERLITLIAVIVTLGGWIAVLGWLRTWWAVIACVAYSGILIQSVSRWRKRQISRKR
ncbi:hypothetical protein C5E08_15715 [Rathayibacter iranicus]|uniref:Uncharacterized protein n=1 Tax=Rathayibacter iranicus TaxID=59737 RepID=A0AAD1AFB6_9MICO|nr:hypothetical protein C7V51_15960 [Rathayibacter iranicus]PPI41224.1 hypothetical protein C5E09_14825 [Rathayibacter iranicus]PPI57470.1 hypothetical protein C5E08_15715 [Rathayibacter iranicus]PPI68216.1 hypothetical protein C5E01_14765 [Rathayibacter iranicus]